MFKQIKAGVAVTSALYLVLGCCLAVWPELSIRLCCYVLGGLLVLSGSMQVRRYLRREGRLFFSYLSLVCGILCLAAGLFLLLQPAVAVSIFPVLFGLFVVFDSAARFGSALDLRRAGYHRWWSFLLLSLLSVALGIFMMTNPFGTATAMVVAVGVILIIEGAVNLFSLLYSAIIVRCLEKQAARLAEEACPPMQDLPAASAQEPADPAAPAGPEPLPQADPSASPAP